MLVMIALVSSLLAATSVSIVEPVDEETYDGDWLTLRAIIENENEIPDSVHYALNGEQVTLIPRLATDWPTYMQNYLNHGYSESPAPLDNTILWTAAVTSELHEFPTPVVVDGIVYYPSNSGTDSLYALDVATGEIIWKYHVGPTDDAVTVADGILYTASDSIYCLNALTGDLVWVNGDANADGGTPIVIEDRVYCGISISIEESHFLCLDAYTGTEIWAETFSGYLGSCMAYWNGMLFVPTNKPLDYSPLYAIDATTGSLIWEYNESYSGFWDSSPNIVDGVIYISDQEGYTRAFDAVTGNMLWASQLSIEGIQATPAYYNQRLYFANQDNNYYCLDAASGSIIWTNEGTCQHGSSGIADGMVFYGEYYSFGSPDSSRVVALDCETGAEVWSFPTTSGPYPGFHSSPSITDGVVYYACNDGYLYAFGTGLKYTYREDYFYADVGSNELIVTSWDDGVAVAGDTINFTVTQTGITLAPSRFLKFSASPNPFHGSSAITFELTEPGIVSLQIFDLTGRTVTFLVDQEVLQGEHSVQWNGCSGNGQPVSAGLYFCRIECGGVVESTGLCLFR